MIMQYRIVEPSAFMMLQHAHFIYMKNTYFSKSGFNQRGNIYVTCGRMGHIWKPKQPLKLDCARHKVAFVGMSYHGEYGHFIDDMFGPILSIPSELSKDAHFYVNFDISGFKQHAEACGLDPDRCHTITDDWCYARDVYFVWGERGINHMPVAVNDMKNYIINYFKLDQIKPTKHTFLDKSHKRWGHIGNIDELYSLSVKNYPHYEWQAKNASNILKENAMTVASSKVLISCYGSALFNTIFLKENCSCYIFASELHDQLAIKNVLLSKVFFIVVNFKFGHGHLEPSRRDPDLFFRTFKILDYVSIHHKWPSYDDQEFHQYFNYHKMIDEARNYINNLRSKYDPSELQIHVNFSKY